MDGNRTHTRFPLFFAHISTRDSVSIYEAEWLRAISIESIWKDSQLLDQLQFAHSIQLSFWFGIDKSTNRTCACVTDGKKESNFIIQYVSAYEAIQETFQQTQQICRTFYFNLKKCLMNRCEFTVLINIRAVNLRKSHWRPNKTAVSSVISLCQGEAEANEEYMCSFENCKKLWKHSTMRRGIALIFGIWKKLIKKFTFPFPATDLWTQGSGVCPLIIFA